MSQDRLTPDQFVSCIRSYYDRYAGSKAFGMWVGLEERLSAKAANIGHVKLADLVEIAKWGGNQYNIAGRVQRANTDREVERITGQAISHIGKTAEAFRSMLKIRQWGTSFATKTLRAICPRDYAALDSKLLEGINRSYLPSRNEVERYVQFLNLCGQIKEMAPKPGPRANGEWFIADIEMALFQFVWDGGRIV